MSDEREIEQSVTREQAVATMQAVVDGVASGTLRFDAADAETVDVEVPDVVELEVELELEDGGDDVELEVELEWPVEEPEDVDEQSSSSPGSQARQDADASAAGHESEPAAESETETPSTDASEEQETEGAADAALDPESDGPHAIDAAVLGPAEQRESLARFEVYQDRADEWRWRLVHHNGNVIADGGEGYTSKQSALKGLRSVMANAPGAAVQDESKD